MGPLMGAYGFAKGTGGKWAQGAILGDGRENDGLLKQVASGIGDKLGPSGRNPTG